MTGPGGAPYDSIGMIANCGNISDLNSSINDFIVGDC
jgi:hypothetical protein